MTVKHANIDSTFEVVEIIECIYNSSFYLIMAWEAETVLFFANSNLNVANNVTETYFNH